MNHEQDFETHTRTNGDDLRPVSRNTVRRVTYMLTHTDHDP
jgi:hypothetical protein